MLWLVFAYHQLLSFHYPFIVQLYKVYAGCEAGSAQGGVAVRELLGGDYSALYINYSQCTSGARSINVYCLLCRIGIKRERIIFW